MRKSRLSRFGFLLGGILWASCSNPSQAPQEPEAPTIDTPIAVMEIDTRGIPIPKNPKIMSTLKVYVNEELIQTQPMGIESIGIGFMEDFEKTSYGLESWTANGLDMDVSILSLPEEEDWILYGVHHDKSLIRHALLMDLCRDLGYYAPRYDFVELSVNGSYKGVYIFSEKIKRDNLRLDLFDLSPDENDAASISGGYILAIDDYKGDRGERLVGDPISFNPKESFRSNRGSTQKILDYPAFGVKRGEEMYYLFEDPADDAISEAQKNYITNYVNDFESALLQDSFTGNSRDYTTYINRASFVDYFLLQELSANPDAYRFHSFIHKDRNGPLTMGPIWMGNLSFGNGSLSRAEGWRYTFNQEQPENDWHVPFWWARLLEDPEFVSAIKSRWKELRGNKWSESALKERIDTYYTRLKLSGVAARNFEQWSIFDELFTNSQLNSISHEEEVAYLNEWIHQRLAWMDLALEEL